MSYMNSYDYPSGRSREIDFGQIQASPEALGIGTLEGMRALQVRSRLPDARAAAAAVVATANLAYRLLRPSAICFFFVKPRETIRYDWLMYSLNASSERPGLAKCWIHFNPRDARYGAGRSPGRSLSISYDISLTLNVKPRCLSSHPAMANTLPPTFHTCDPPHWTTYAAAGRDRQNALNSSYVMDTSDFAFQRFGTVSSFRQARPNDESYGLCRDKIGAVDVTLAALRTSQNAPPRVEREVFRQDRCCARWENNLKLNRATSPPENAR